MTSLEPTSAGLILPVCLLAAVAFVLSVRRWPRLTGRGPLPLLARSGLLLTCQVLLTAAIVLISNRYFVFYATWKDLLGSDRVNVKVKQVQQSKGAEADPAVLVRRTTTGLGPSRRGRKHDPVKDGQVDRLDITGARSGLRGEAYVYLPPEYFRPEYAAKRLPVTIFMSGAPSDDRLAWIKQARLPRSAVEGASGPPMISVMIRSPQGLSPVKQPPAGPEAGKGLPHRGKPVVGRPTACLDVPGQRGGRAETFYAQDLPVALGDTYRLPQSRQGWGIAGFGASGQCATRLAMLHSDRFAAAASISGVFTAAQGPFYGGSRVYQQDNDLLWRLKNLPTPPIAFLAAAGKADPRTIQQAAQFVRLVRPPMTAQQLVLAVSPETLQGWQGHVPHVADWLVRHLRTDQ
ncbi:alpha/beta hydrolase [Spirillospora sp. NPDC048911]|uniref:alpha/beta hydrolase n=1 Tax=Spirillospora sp. NPDC048911 TaxID=3364527 RepID=UPI0037138E4D